MKGNLVRRTLSCAALLILSTGSSSLSQQLWEPVDGPYIGRVFSLCIDDNNEILAGTERGGVFRSDDAGAEWAYAGLSYEVVRTLYRHSDGRLYAGLQNGLMFSTDNGGTWEWSNFSTSNNGFGIGVTSTGTLFVGGWGGLARSTDQGATFENVSLTPFSNRVDEIFIGANDEILVGLYQGGLIRSVDNGQTWNLADPLFESKSVAAITGTGGMMFAGIQGVDVFRSSDGGATWAPSTSGISSASPSALYARSAQEIWAGTTNGQFLSSTDGGMNWTTQFTIPEGSSVSQIIEAPGGPLLAATQWGGVHISTDNGTSWIQSNKGLTNVMPTAATGFVLDSKDNLYLSYTGGPVVKSSNGGRSWTPFGSKDDYVNCLAIGPGDMLYTGSQYTGVRHTSDNGATWEHDTTGLPQFTPITLALNALGDFAVGGTDGKLYVREAGASVWRSAKDALITSNVNCLLWENGALFAATTRDGLFRSKDKGLSWTKLDNGMNEGYVRTIYSDHQGKLFLGAFGSIYVSTDNGDSWADIGDGSFSSVSSIVSSTDGMLYAASFGGGVFMTNAQSSSWTAFNSGLLNPHVLTLLLDGNNTLFASTDGNGVFHATAPVVSVKNPAAAVEGLQLHSAYPNPFTSAAQLSFALPAASHVRIAVYDMTGREVAVLVDGLRPAGLSTVSVVATGLPPGMYFCRMHVGTEMRTQPLMILR
ncbi:MAG: T9SS type A sorting domain-containing protein [Bacteroidetes bacterium]|nr:T9SS type A sorting domain-containing protein [Bacteroidota bacterium]